MNNFTLNNLKFNCNARYNLNMWGVNDKRGINPIKQYMYIKNTQKHIIGSYIMLLYYVP